MCKGKDMSNVFETYDRAEKRLRMGAVNSFWRVFDHFINESLPPWKTFLRVISWRLPLLTWWNLTNFENNPIQQEVSEIPNTSCIESFRARKQFFSEVVHPLNFLYVFFSSAETHMYMHLSVPITLPTFRTAKHRSWWTLKATCTWR